MTKEQLELIAALLAGQQVAIVHLSMKLAEQAGLDKRNWQIHFAKRQTIWMKECAIKNHSVDTQPDCRWH
ncbi:hypothetical protein [Escherichia coli]|uniref:hypothetical protein n=1 Tax=Escherichia coli TaxID=562 RepID=UPI002FCCFA43